MYVEMMIDIQSCLVFCIDADRLVMLIWLYFGSAALRVGSVIMQASLSSDWRPVLL